MTSPLVADAHAQRIGGVDRAVVEVAVGELLSVQPRRVPDHRGAMVVFVWRGACRDRSGEA